MLNWYIFAIICLFAYGIQYFLYNVSAKRKYNSAWTSVSYMATVAILSTIFFLLSKQTISNFSILFLFAGLNAITFFSVTITRIEAFKNIPITIAFPIMRMHAVIVAIFSIIYFKEVISLYQIFGIVFATIMVIILSIPDKKEKIKKSKFNIGLILTFGALLSAVFGSIIVKFSTLNDVNNLGFMFVSYFISTLFSLIFIKKLGEKGEEHSPGHALRLGFIIGIFNFVGFYAFMNAVKLGPLAVVSPLVSMSFVLSIILSVIIYKEKLNLRKSIGIGLAILATILMGL